ncbi:hypothetical protein BDB01DRAFT_835441 [Pilobolus umbonatus]|nr:hypothetical protein BDB01DRAFT_835441 [Pilobolus umbonatus]
MLTSTTELILAAIKRERDSNSSQPSFNRIELNRHENSDESVDYSYEIEDEEEDEMKENEDEEMKEKDEDEEMKELDKIGNEEYNKKGMTDKKYRRIIRKRRRMNVIMVDGRFKCSECDTTFAQKGGLVRHLERGHIPKSNKIETLPCENARITCKYLNVTSRDVIKSNLDTNRYPTKKEQTNYMAYLKRRQTVAAIKSGQEIKNKVMESAYCIRKDQTAYDFHMECYLELEKMYKEIAKSLRRNDTLWLRITTARLLFQFLQYAFPATVKTSIDESYLPYFVDLKDQMELIPETSNERKTFDEVDKFFRQNKSGKDKRMRAMQSIMTCLHKCFASSDYDKVKLSINCNHLIYLMGDPLC